MFDTEQSALKWTVPHKSIKYIFPIISYVSITLFLCALGSIALETSDGNVTLEQLPWSPVQWGNCTHPHRKCCSIRWVRNCALPKRLTLIFLPLEGGWREARSDPPGKMCHVRASNKSLLEPVEETLPKGSHSGTTFYTWWKVPSFVHRSFFCECSEKMSCSRCMKDQWVDTLV